MRDKCIVCGNSSIEVPRMFYFPRNFEKAKVWFKALGMGVQNDWRNLLLCIDHFDKSMYDRSNKLFRTAVPTPFTKEKSVHLEKLLLPLEKLVPPLEKLVPPLEKLAPPLEKLVPPLEKLVPPLKKLMPPSEKFVPPLEMMVPPLVMLVPPLAKLTPPSEKLVPPPDYNPEPKPKITPEEFESSLENVTVNGIKIEYEEVSPNSKRLCVEKVPDEKEANAVSTTTSNDAAVQASKDECDVYGELLAVKLRNLDENTRYILMHEIDSLTFRTRMNLK